MITRTQSLALTVKSTSILSFFGSLWIAQDVLKDPHKRGVAYQRLLLAMSLSDISSSLWMFIGTWAIPVGSKGVFMPLGDEVTCNIQGFFIQLGIITPIYNASLAVYYLLNIKYGWKEKSFRKIEPFFHAAALLWGFGTAIASASWGQYHNSNLWCWISSTPQTNILRWVFYYGPVWTILLFVTVVMLMVYQYVLTQEKSTYISIVDNSSSNNTFQIGDTTHSHSSKKIESARLRLHKKRCKHSRKVAIQSGYYVLAFYLAFIFASLTRLIQTINGKTYFPIIQLFAIFFPMQGFMNFLVYMRPKYLKWRKRKAIKPSIRSSAPPALTGASSLKTDSSEVDVKHSVASNAPREVDKCKTKDEEAALPSAKQAVLLCESLQGNNLNEGREDKEADTCPLQSTIVHNDSVHDIEAATSSTKSSANQFNEGMVFLNHLPQDLDENIYGEIQSRLRSFDSPSVIENDEDMYFS